MSSKIITVRCRICSRTQKVRVEPKWYDSDLPSCCGRSGTFWLRDGEVFTDGGTFDPADADRRAGYEGSYTPWPAT